MADSDPNAWLTERRANGDLLEIASAADLAAMLGSHTHGHHPGGAELRREVVKITSGFKRATIIKPSTDPAKLADRLVTDIDV